jgi:hypothetical protein
MIGDVVGEGRERASFLLKSQDGDAIVSKEYRPKV